MLVQRKELKNIIDAKVIPSDSVAPQHRLLVMDVRLQHRRPVRPMVSLQRIKGWKMTGREAELQGAVKAAISASSSRDVITKWSQLEQIITEVAQNLLGITKTGRPFIDKQTWWWSEEVQSIVKRKKNANKKWLKMRSHENMREYTEAKSAAKRAVSAAKTAYYKDMYDELDTLDGEKKIYRIANARKRASEDLGHVVKTRDKSERLLYRLPDILNRWREHYDTMSNEEFPHPPLPSAVSVLGPVPPIQEEESCSCFSKDGKKKNARPR
ncbi:hypothetical protein Y032_0017g3296 [Ancylostoma ceylanicum]|uniref:Uncharacterized protein n=1 Tax=Ancylostoma ceylanicum TaxID=53326 RepID=A0A016V6I3_9BILA|nr:hypothetical protein Y032_0017g3296 [Ancylostoma ceylanicum]